MECTIMDGVQEDIEDILQSFSALKSRSFRDFVQCWRQHGFQYIYSGRPNKDEMMYFTQEILLMVKYKALMGEDVFLTCGALFLLYGLYFSQPLLKHVSIRVEPNEWNKLWGFVESEKQRSPEMAFCFYKLFLSHAFDFVYRDQVYNLETFRKECAIREVGVKAGLFQELSQEIMQGIDLEESLWAKHEKKYNSLKETVLSHGLCDGSELTRRNFLHPILKAKVVQSSNSVALEGLKTSGSPKLHNKKSRCSRKAVEGLMTAGEFLEGFEEDSQDEDDLGFSMPDTIENLLAMSNDESKE